MERSQKDVASNVLKVVEVENRQRDERTIGERVSEGISIFAGSMVFVTEKVGVDYDDEVLDDLLNPVNPQEPVDKIRKSEGKARKTSIVHLKFTEISEHSGLFSDGPLFSLHTRKHGGRKLRD